MLQIKSFVLLLIISMSGFSLPAQSLSDSITRQIGVLLKPWNSDNSPGYSVGIIKNDSLVYTTSAGMANLEYGIPNTPSTDFNIGSMAKQFTAFDIFLLEKIKKINLDDDIKKYLTWFPNLKYKITIRHLLYHTSGIRDYLILLQIAGTRLEDVITKAQVVKIISRQRRLNSIPGDKYSYSNSNYFLLSEIVEAVSGQTFRAFTDSAIFRPLGMTQSYFEDDYSAIHKNRSYGYERIDSTHFRNVPLYYSLVGAGGMYSNVIDMAKWLINLNNSRAWDKKLIEELTERPRLNNGRILNSAAGLVVQPYLGWRQYYFSGVEGSYRSFQNFFPDLKTGVIVMSNLTDYLYPDDLPYGTTNMLIPRDTTHWDLVPKTWADSASAELSDPKSYGIFEGDYISEEGGFQVSFGLVRNKLNLFVNDQPNLLGQVGKDTFMAVNSYQYRYVFDRTGTQPVITILSGDDSYTLRKITKKNHLTAAELEAYEGRYFCEELDCFYSIEVRNSELFLVSSKYKDENLHIIGIDNLGTDNWWMNHLTMMRSKGKVVGFEVNTGRVMHLYFRKMTLPVH